MDKNKCKYYMCKKHGEVSSTMNNYLGMCPVDRIESNKFGEKKMAGRCGLMLKIVTSDKHSLGEEIVSIHSSASIKELKNGIEQVADITKYCERCLYTESREIKLLIKTKHND